MFSHIYVNRLKCLLNDRTLLFWTLGFSLILATLFYMAFSNLSKADIFEKIPIAVVDSSEYQKDVNFRSTMDAVSYTDKSGKEKALFSVKLTDRDKAEELLKSNSIKGYIYLDNGPHLVVKESGIYPSVLKSFLDNYVQRSSAVHEIIAANPQAAREVIAAASENIGYTKEVSTSRAEPNAILNYFYALIAMTCLYGGFWGLKEITDVQANLSTQGARVNLAPVHKLKIFGYSICASITLQICAVFILLVYLYYVLKVDFGNQIGYILLACVIGCIVGVAFGALVGAVGKMSEGKKVAILISMTMAMSMCSGLQSHALKYAVDQAIPIMPYINPASLVTDTFHALYYYSSHTVFFRNIGILSVMSVVFFLIIYFILRRQRYASI